MSLARALSRSVAPPLLVVVPALYWVIDVTRRASWATLGRDQGIFQYVAWALRQGDLAYRDVRDVNGPLVALVHCVFQWLGGEDEHRFRVLDLVGSGIAFAFAGACLTSLSRSDKDDSPGHRVMRRIGWASAAWVVLSAQYLAYGYWETAQRESFYDWFLLASISLQAISFPEHGVPKARTWMRAALAGAFSVMPWFGKPTFVLFTVAQIVALLADDEAKGKKGKRVAAFFAGGLGGAAVPLLFLLAYGDVRAWLRITFVDVPAMYRFIWPRPASAILALPGYAQTAALAVGTTAVILFLVWKKKMPRRALPIAAMPVCGLVSVIVQAKGFPYHFHPVTLGISLGWLAILGCTWERAVMNDARLARGIVLVAALLLGIRAALTARGTWYPEVPVARDATSLGSEAHLTQYDRIDFFPYALRQAARHIEKNTAPDDRVQAYSMDAYLLFLAHRRSATPYIYAYDLNVDAALFGAFEEGGRKPTAAQQEVIRAMRDAHERDMLARLERTPPAAFVFVGRSPLMSDTDALEDFRVHCPDAARFMDLRYRQTADFDGIRVFLRNDLADKAERENLR
jgi:hypothetical protein